MGSVRQECRSTSRGDVADRDIKVDGAEEKDEQPERSEEKEEEAAEDDEGDMGDEFEQEVVLPPGNCGKPCRRGKGVGGAEGASIPEDVFECSDATEGIELAEGAVSEEEAEGEAMDADNA